MMHNEYKLLDCVTGKIQEGGKDDGERAVKYSGIVKFIDLTLLFTPFQTETSS